MTRTQMQKLWHSGEQRKSLRRRLFVVLAALVVICSMESVPWAVPAVLADTPGTFAATGTMASARQNHTATLLPNGKVLLAGGANPTGTLASAELYDPAAGTFTATTNTSTGTPTTLGNARQQHTATLLPNGKVLIAGGTNPSGGGTLASAELYDPAAGTFTPTTNTSTGTPTTLGTTRQNHTATLLPNGKVLVAGGVNSSGALASAELYDPAAGTFTATTNTSTGTTTTLGTARQQHTATLLPNGKVLIAGGIAGGIGGSLTAALASAELYDPAAGTFTATTNTSTGTTTTLGTTRLNHTATLLPNGKVLIAGGQNSTGPLASAELYDPAGGTFTATASMGTARQNHTATLLPSGRVLIAGGINPSTIGPLASAELYDPAAGTFTATGALGTARDIHTATLLPNGKVLLAGGAGGSGVLASAELYCPDLAATPGTWTATGSMATARVGHSATLLPQGTVLVAGGNSNGVVVSSAEIYVPAANNGTGAFTATGSMAAARENHTATLLPNGKVLFTGGFAGGNCCASGVLATAELYDPAASGGAGAFLATGSMATARVSHTATLLPNGQVLITGGVTNGDATVATAELYNPAANGGLGAFTATGSMATARASQTATLLPTGKVLVAGGSNSSGVLNSAELFDPAANSGAGAFTATGSMGTARVVHTATLLTTGKVLMVGGQTSGGVALASAELYDPAANGGAGAFSATGSMGTARDVRTALLLPTGRVLVAGGVSGTTYLASAEVFDSTTGMFSPTGAMATPRFGETLTLLPNGKSLSAGGFNNGTYLASAELYSTTICGPELSTVVPTSGAVGTTVTITGFNFGATQGTSTVSFNGATAASATSWSNTQIVTAVPSGATNGPVDVTVNGFASNGLTFGVPDFTLLASPPSQSVLRGNATSYTVTLGSLNGFNSPVVLTVLCCLPSGASFSGGNPVTPPGSATLTINTSGTTPAGTYTVTIQGFGGGQTHVTSVSVVVQKSDTTAVMVSSVNPSVFGQSVTFTATVTAVAPGAGTPTGPVTFTDGVTTLGTRTLNAAGQATFATSALAVSTPTSSLTHSITASYSGDPNFNPSTSAALSQTVNKADTMTVVVPSPNPALVGPPVTFTATVTVKSPGAGTPFAPTGGVQISEVFDGPQTFSGPGGIVLSGGGMASLTTSALTTSALLLGPHLIMASYSGDANFNPSTSTAVTETVTAPITTVAGTGQGSFGGDGDAAINAKLRAPFAAVVDGAGNIFIADFANNRVRRVDAATKVISTIAGTGVPGFNGDGILATAAKINGPIALAVDVVAGQAATTLLIAEFNGQRIRQVNLITGFITTVAGTGNQGVAVNSFPPGCTTACTTFVAATDPIKGTLYHPTGVALDKAGTIYIADSINQQVRKVVSGNIFLLAGSPTGVAGFRVTDEGGPAINALLNAPRGVAVDGNTPANVWITEVGNNVIRKVNAASGTINTVAGTQSLVGSFGGDGGSATAALFSAPSALAVDASGHLLIVDTANGRIRKVFGGTIPIIATVADLNGQSCPLSTGSCGDGGFAINGQLNTPTGVAVDLSGNLFIGDLADNKTRRVGP